MSKAGYVILAILLLALAYFSYTQYSGRKMAEIGLANQYSKSFYELSANVDAVTINLGKVLASSSQSQRAESLAQITRDSFTAQAYLNNMPLPLNMLLRTSQFLNQLGDYTLSLARTSAITPLSNSDKETLRTLFDNSKSLGKQLEDIQQKAEVGKLTWDDLSKETQKNPTQPTAFKDGFQLISDELDRVPSLTYDGPFSEHLENLTPKGLVGSEISKEEAERIAEKVAQSATGNKVDLQFEEEVKGQIPAFSFASKNGQIRVDVSKKGGFVLQFLNARNIDKTKISIEDAIKKAKAFVQAQNFPLLETSYTLVESHTLVVPFVPEENGVLLYPDLIKVEVALDNGEILAQDAISYIMNHRNRNLPPPVISQSEAEATLSDELTPTTSKLVVIPKTTTTEAFCYEIKAQLKNTKEEFLVYLDALTGLEVNILYIVPSGKGTLAM